MVNTKNSKTKNVYIRIENDEPVIPEFTLMESYNMNEYLSIYLKYKSNLYKEVTHINEWQLIEYYKKLIEILLNLDNLYISLLLLTFKKIKIYLF